MKCRAMPCKSVQPASAVPACSVPSFCSDCGIFGSAVEATSHPQGSRPRHPSDRLHLPPGSKRLPASTCACLSSEVAQFWLGGTGEGCPPKRCCQRPLLLIHSGFRMPLLGSLGGCFVFKILTNFVLFHGFGLLALRVFCPVVHGSEQELPQW